MMNRKSRAMDISKSKNSRRGHSMSIIRSNVYSDPRDFTNKRNKKAILRRLFRLLEENQIQHTFVYQKWLKDTPLTKNVLFLFEWLFRLIDDKFELKYSERAGKEVIDYKNVYKIIKLLSYHGKLKEKELRSLLPHSWTSCVFVFDLLMEMVHYTKMRERSSPPSRCIQVDSFNFYESYLRRVYPQFMRGMNEAERNQWRKNILGDIENEIRKLEDYSEQCRSEIEVNEEKYKEMQSDTNNMLSIERQKRELNEDLRKIRNRVNEVRRKNKDIIRSTEHEELQSFRVTGEIRQIETVLGELRHQVPVPYSSVSDGQQLKQNFLRKTHEVSESRGSVELLKREVMELEQATEKMEREKDLTVRSINTKIRSCLARGFQGVDESWVLDTSTPRTSQFMVSRPYDDPFDDNANDSNLQKQISELEQKMEQLNRMSLPSFGRRVQDPPTKRSSFIVPPPSVQTGVRRSRMVDEDESGDEGEEEEEEDDDDDDMSIDFEVHKRRSITEELNQLMDIKSEIEAEERRSFELSTKSKNMERKIRQEQGEMKQITMNMYNMVKNLHQENEQLIREVGRATNELKKKKDQVYSGRKSFNSFF